MRSLLTALGLIAVWSTVPVWGLYCIYQLFALSAPFWSTVGFSLMMGAIQFVIGLVLTVYSVLK